MKLTLLFVLALALFAETPKSPTLPPKPVAPAEASTPAKPAPKSLPPPAPMIAATDTAAICRSACDRTYYVCLAGDDPDTCPSNWLLCRKSCASPQN